MNSGLARLWGRVIGMKLLLWVGFVLAVLTLASCSYSYRNMSQIKKADSLSSCDGNRALAYIDSLRCHERLSVADSQLLWTIKSLIRMEQGNKFTAYDTLNIIKQNVEDNLQGNDRMYGLFWIAKVEMQLGYSPEALQTFDDAAHAVDSTAANCDFELLARVYGQRAWLMLQQQLPQLALREARQAEGYAWKAKDAFDAIVYREVQAYAYEDMNKPDSAIFLSRQNINLFTKYGFSKDAAITKGTLFTDLVKTKQYTEAHKVMQDYESKSGYFDADGNIEGSKIDYYYDKGLYFKQIGKLDSAAHYFYKFITPKSFLPTLSKVYNGLYQIYKIKNEKDSVVKYAVLSKNTADSAYASMSTEKLIQIYTLYNYNNAQKQINYEKEQVQQIRWNAIMVCLVLSLLLALAIALFYRRNITVQSLLRNLSERHLLAMQKMEMLDKRKKELDALLKLKDEELKESIQHKSEEIALLQQKISTYEANAVINDDEQLLTASIVKKFHQLAKNNQKPNLAEWAELKLFVNEQIPTLAARQDMFSNSEYEICLLVRIMFRPSEIATLTGRKPSDVSTMRTRMLYKVTGQKGSSKDFDVFIRHFK